MTKALLFLKKLITLAVNTLVFMVFMYYNVPFYITLPILLLAFSVISSRITGETPKELYNFQRSEKYFVSGGLRDLIRIPVVLFAFIHDVFVWFIWGIYQLFTMLVDIIYFVKEALFYFFHGIIWYILQLVPFWRIVVKFIYLYFIKWPWWIYRYAFKAIRLTYNWNVLRVSLSGTLIALLLIQSFFFLDIILNLFGLRFIGLILALLPISWIFGEISSIRGLKLMKAPFHEVKFKFRNGIETVRGILFFLTFFVVLLFAQAGFNWFGLLPKARLTFIGFNLNINYLINIILIFLCIIIVYGSLVLPTFRLYNEFSETSIKNVVSLLSYIGKRIAQITAGIIPSAFFSVIAALPLAIITAIAIMATVSLKNNIIELKIDKLVKEQQAVTDHLQDYRYTKQITELKYIEQFANLTPGQIIRFPDELMEEIRYRPLIQNEIETYKRKIIEKGADLASFKETINLQLSTLQQQLNDEKGKPVVNETRIEELNLSIGQYQSQLTAKEKSITNEINELKTDTGFAERKYRQLPVMFYLNSLFLAVCSTFFFVFIFGYFGNFFYSTFVFRNDNQPAEWKTFINNERKINSRQPLLSVTLNILTVIIIYLLIFNRDIFFL